MSLDIADTGDWGISVKKTEGVSDLESATSLVRDR